jgi:hypothetical protein
MIAEICRSSMAVRPEQMLEQVQSIVRVHTIAMPDVHVYPFQIHPKKDLCQHKSAGHQELTKMME